MSDTVIREINTPEVRRAISDALVDELGYSTALAVAAAKVFVILDRASAGLPLDGAQ